MNGVYVLMNNVKKRRNIMYFIMGYFLKLSNIYVVNVYIIIYILIYKNGEKFNNVNVY